MNNILKKDKIQQEALKAWIDNGKKGTTEIITGLGKSFIGLHALYTMPRDDKIHLFLAEVTDRKKDIYDDIIKYNKIFKRDVLNDYKLEFHCYQSAYKWKDKEFGLVIADEVHESLSPSYSEFFFNNKYDAVIGLSATINKNTEYIDDDGNVFTKGDLLNKIAPICYKYNLNQAKEDKTTRKLNIYVIHSELDNITKYIKAGNAKKRFFQTEKASYDYWDKEFKKSLFIEDEELKSKKIIVTSNKRQTIIYNSLNKIEAVKQIVKVLNSKVLIFANSLDSLLKVTPNVISSRNNDDKNDILKDQFNKGKIKELGSFKKVKQGANIDNLDNVILMSYYGTTLDFIQRVGRLRDNGSEGNVFILLTKNTQEMVWFKNMLEDFELDNIQYFKNINEFIKYYK